MATRFDHILIIADIEGSSGCWDYRASKFMTDEWSRACVEMTLDVNAVVRGLFDAGVKQVTVKDFHRTGYNLLPEMIDPMARVVLGQARPKLLCSWGCMPLPAPKDSWPTPLPHA